MKSILGTEKTISKKSSLPSVKRWFELFDCHIETNSSGGVFCISNSCDYAGRVSYYLKIFMQLFTYQRDIQVDRSNTVLVNVLSLGTSSISRICS